MNLGQLRAQARILLDDTEQDYLWSDAELNLYINDAEQEACIRALLIDDDNNADFNISVNTTSKRYALNENIVLINGARLLSRPDDPFDAWVATETHLMLNELLVQADTLVLSVYRLPLAPMVSDNDTPEINSKHHYRLLDWVLYRAYSKKDSDAEDIARAQKHEMEFIKSFGQRQDNNVLRKQKSNRPKTVAFNREW